MRVHGVRMLGLALGLAFASGCVSLKRTPEARFFVLEPVIEAPVGEVTPHPGSVGVLPVSLPGHLERPQVVTETGGNEVRIDEFVRWAEPLGPALTRILAENLAGALPERLILHAPWSAATRLRCRVRVEVEAFAPHTDGSVRLAGRWALLEEARSSRVLALRRFDLRAGPVPTEGDGGIDARAGAEAMSRLLGQLAQEIATAIANLPEPLIEERLETEPAPAQ